MAPLVRGQGDQVLLLRHDSVSYRVTVRSTGHSPSVNSSEADHYAGKSSTCHYGAVAAKEPRDAEVADACRLLGRRLAEWVAVVADGRKDQHPLAKPESRTLPG